MIATIFKKLQIFIYKNMHSSLISDLSLSDYVIIIFSVHIKVPKYIIVNQFIGVCIWTLRMLIKLVFSIVVFQNKNKQKN